MWQATLILPDLIHPAATIATRQHTPAELISHLTLLSHLTHLHLHLRGLDTTAVPCKEVLEQLLGSCLGPAGMPQLQECRLDMHIGNG